MAKVQQVALKPLRYAGAVLAPGDTFTATARDARTLKAIGKSRDPVANEGDADAKLQKLAEMVKKEKTPAPPPPRRRGRPPGSGAAKKSPAAKSTRYNRRDMQPEATAKVQAEDVVAKAPEAAVDQVAADPQG